MKNTKKIIVFILSITLVVSSVHAQVSGYMGKRYLLTAEGLFSPAILNPNFNTNSGLTCFNFTKALSFDYVLNRKKMLGLTFQIYNTTFDANKGILEYTYFDPENQSYCQVYEEGNGYAEIFGYNIGINIKMFTSDWIAPLGRYVQFEAFYMNYTVSEVSKLSFGDINDFEDYYYYEMAQPDLDAKSFYKNILLTFSTGKERIIYNRIVLRRGFQTGFIFSGLPGEPFKVDRYTESTFVKKMTRERLYCHFLINFRFGVGILLY